MISFAQIKTIEKQKISAQDTDETAETKIENFAALFSAPAREPNNSAGKTAESDKKTSGAGATDQNSQAALLPAREPQSFTGDAIEENVDFERFLASQQSDRQNAGSLQPNGKVFSDEARELIKNYLESGQAEVLNEGENAAYFAGAQNSFSETAIAQGQTKSEAEGLLPQLFREVSSVFKNDEQAAPKKTGSSSDFISESEAPGEIPNAAPGESNSAENGNALNHGQPEFEILKEKKQIKSTEDFTAVGFDEILSSEPKGQSSAEAARQAQFLPGKVFEQIEPKILQILTLKNVENEKKIIKMRLHPAELGTLEIRLEKDAAGSLNIRFQTETEAARQIINQGLEQLREALKNSGLTLERLEVSCAPFSSTAGSDSSRENESRHFETIENRLKTQAVSGDSSEGRDDLKSNSSNRLLSVRA